MGRSLAHIGAVLGRTKELPARPRNARTMADAAVRITISRSSLRRAVYAGLATSRAPAHLAHHPIDGR